MDLHCYLHPTWKPRIRAADPSRAWMNDSPESFAYRCLPLTMANAHGWEILSPCTFRARWRGEGGTDSIDLVGPADVPVDLRPVSLFGQGVLTFHVQGLFRTPPRWNMWIGGPPNSFKDGIQALTGLVETDWSPYTFTMNWRFTRPDQWIEFQEGEPICFFFPIPRGYLERVEPRFAPFEEKPDLSEEFAAWSRSRDAFQAEVARNPPELPADKWQKNYYRGMRPDGSKAIPDHQAKLRLREFK